MTPLLDVYTVTWNEQIFLHDFIKFYKNRCECNIIILDNDSTDQTVEIAKDYGCEVRSFSTNNQMDEHTLIKIRNTCWLDSTAKFRIVCDSDEFVDVNQSMLENAIKEEWDYCICEGYEMFGFGEKWEALVRGIRSVGYCKPVLFKDTIHGMNFAPGSHSANPTTLRRENPLFVINYPKLYHTKWRDYTYGLNRQRILAQRVSSNSKNNGWNFHYGLDESIHKEYFMNGLKNSKVIR
jgi:hypothetical protein